VTTKLSTILVEIRVCILYSKVFPKWNSLYLLTF